MTPTYNLFRSWPLSRKRLLLHLGLVLGLTFGASCAEQPFGPQEPGPGTGGTPGAGAVVSRLFFPVTSISATVGDKNTVKVYAFDSLNAPVKGVSILWTTTSGRVSPTVSVTDATGQAVTDWQSGQVAGDFLIGAKTGDISKGLGVKLVAGVATKIVKVSGDNQSTIPSAYLPAPLVVKVTDNGGNPVRGALVQWQIDSTTTIVTEPDTSDINGLVSARWQLGKKVGSYAATAIFGTQKVGFTAKVVPPEDQAPVRIIMVDSAANNQLAPVNRAPAIPYRVRVLDANGRPVPGTVVKWMVGVGGGLVNPSQSITDSNGEAAASRQYGPRSGSMTTLAILNDNLDPVVFAGTAYEASTNASAIFALSGSGQKVAVGATYPNPLIAKVQDNLGNAVVGAQVRWAVLDGGGAIVSDTITVSDSLGTVMASARAGAVAGDDTQSYRASLVSMPGTGVRFTLSTVGAEPNILSIVSGGGQTLLPQDTSASVTVSVRDRYGNPVVGVEVRASALSGDTKGFIVTAVTNDQGQTTVRWIAGNIGGPVSFQIYVASAPEITASVAGSITGINLRAVSATNVNAIVKDTVLLTVDTRKTDGTNALVGNVLIQVSASPTATGGGVTLVAPPTRTGADGTTIIKAVVTGSTTPQTVSVAAAGQTIVFTINVSNPQGAMKRPGS